MKYILKNWNKKIEIEIKLKFSKKSNLETANLMKYSPSLKKKKVCLFGKWANVWNLAKTDGELRQHSNWSTPADLQEESSQLGQLTALLPIRPPAATERRDWTALHGVVC